MKKQTIELPIEWIEGLNAYIENVKKTATLEDIYSSHRYAGNFDTCGRFAVTALLGYLESLQIIKCSGK